MHNDKKPSLSAAHTGIDACWVENGELHAVVCLNGSKPFQFQYAPMIRVSRFDGRAIAERGGQEAHGEVLGQRAASYDFVSIGNYTDAVLITNSYN